MVVPSMRRASLSDTDTVVRVPIASKEASFTDTIEDHDRDAPFWARRWRDYILRGRLPLAIFGDGWVFLAEVAGAPVAYVAYHHTRRHRTDAELQNIEVLRGGSDGALSQQQVGDAGTIDYPRLRALRSPAAP